MSRPPLPPYDRDSAAQKARAAEDAWNTCDPVRVSLANTEDSRWRNRDEFLAGREAIVAFLTRKWSRELDYRLVKHVWAFAGNHIPIAESDRKLTWGGGPRPADFPGLTEFDL